MPVRRLLIAGIGLMFAVVTTCLAETYVFVRDCGRDNIAASPDHASLPERLRLALEENPAADDEPVSAEEPCNLYETTVHPDKILESLQESVELLSAAGLKAEAAEATQLLKNYQQKHQVRLLLEVQDAELMQHCWELDRLRRRLGRFDLEPTKDTVISSVLELRSNEVEFPAVSDERNFDYGRCLIDSRPRAPGSYSYTMSPVWLQQMEKTNMGAEPQRLVLTVREIDLYCRIIHAAKARAYELIFPKPPRQRL